MIVDFSKTINDMDDMAVMVQPDQSKPLVPLTLRTVAVNALLLPRASDRELSAEKKIERFLLAQKIHQSTEPVDIPVKSLAELLLLIVDSNTTLVAARACLLIDPDNQSKN